MKLEQWATWAEIGASLGVIVTLVFLVFELRENTLAIEKQVINDRAEALNSPFLGESQLPSILEKIKAVDGPELLEHELMQRYGLSHSEALIWARYQGLIWSGLESEYVRSGDSAVLRERIQHLDSFPDIHIVLKHLRQVSPEFMAYIEAVRQSPLDPGIREYREQLQKTKQETQGIGSDTLSDSQLTR